MDSKMKNQYDQLFIGKENDEEPVWIKKLKIILDADIHNKPLGCKISDTHVKIGEVHMGAFYEAQILFSHARWIRKFSEWLDSRMREQLEGKQNVKNIVIIGYETYIEPVLYTLKQKIEDNSDWCVYYGIYEEPKFIQNKAGAKTDVRIRYIEDVLELNTRDSTQVFFVCGISSTLHTLKKMKELFWSICEKENCEDEKNCIFYTLIQILPSKNDSKYCISWNRKQNQQKNVENIVTSSKYDISAQYLVNVACEWHDADKCPLCFPSNPIDEKPIIQTSETSIVPIQMIDSAPTEKNERIIEKDEIAEYKIDFFRKKRGKYKYKEYLYYNHIDRMDHHYKYYIRTGHLFKKILSDKEEKEKFKIWCNIIQQELSTQDDVVNIIISPSHFSDEVFPNAINRYVFEGRAHMISFDPKKEFRSNFETKYSNIAYFIQQIKNAKKPVNIRFYYVDDQLVSGDMFYRVKSLVKSLMSEGYILSENIKIFDAVIIFLSRVSNSSKMDYVEDINRYYSFVDIGISSIRNYGDSCPICKLKQDAAVYTQVSSLDVCAKHWSDKYWYHSTKTLEEVKKAYFARKDKEKKVLSERHFRRMECEHILCEKTKYCFSKEEFLNRIVSAILEKKDRSGEIQCEYLISFIKAMAVPFLYYKENEKKAATYILLCFITQFKDVVSNCSQLHKFRVNMQELPVKFKNEYEKYSLVAVLINCLAEMDSTYLLNTQRIVDLCVAVKRIDERLLGFEKVNLEGDFVEGFFAIVVNACKRIVCGIGGDSKIKHMDMELKNVLERSDQDEVMCSLWRVLYLENINKSFSLSDMEEEYGKCVSNRTTQEVFQINNTSNRTMVAVEEYSNISNMLKVISEQKNIRVHFLYYDNTLESTWFHLHIDEYDRVGDTKLNQIELLEKIPQEGVGWNANECILRLHHYDIAGITGQTDYQKMAQKEASDVEVEKDVYLYIRFENVIGREQLDIIRKMLQYRYDLCVKIAKDISADAIKVAIQAKAAEDLLKSDKAISHGAEEELSLLIMQAASLIEAHQFQKNTQYEKIEKSELFRNACNGTNIFMNRCIGYSNTHQIIQQYFTSPTLDLKMQNQQSPFYNSVQHVHALSWKQGWEFFETYLQELSNYGSQYLKELIKKRDKESNITITFKPNINEFANRIRQVDSIPFFLNAGGAEAKYSMVFMVGILDAFVRNAVKHGVIKDGVLHITFELQMEDGKNQEENQYRILVSNEAHRGIENTGITKKFFDVINKARMKNAENYFEVDFSIKQEKTKWTHIAILDVVRCFAGSENSE